MGFIVKFVIFFAIGTGIAALECKDFYMAMLLGFFGACALSYFTMESIESQQLNEVKEIRKELHAALKAK